MRIYGGIEDTVAAYMRGRGVTEAAFRADTKIASAIAKNSRRKTLGTAAKRMIKGNSGKIAMGVATGYAVGGVMRRHGRPVDRISGRPTGVYGF